MKLHSVLSQVVLPIAVISSALLLPVIAEEEEETPLQTSMNDTNRELKSLRKIDATDWKAGAEAARAAAEGMLRGFQHLPIVVNGMPEGKEKTVAIADYRRLMGLGYAAICELELAYLAEDQEMVDAAQVKIKASKKEGHQKYEE